MKAEPKICPLCARKLRLKGKKLYCKCGYVETDGDRQECLPTTISERA